MARTRAKEAAEGANGIPKGARKEAERGCAEEEREWKLRSEEEETGVESPVRTCSWIKL